MVAVTNDRFAGYRPGMRKCLGCGKFFTFYHGLNASKKYCNHACVQKSWRARNPQPKVLKDRSYGFYLGQCPGCGKDVWGTNKQQKYCPGSKCRVAALRKRRTAAVDQSSNERSLPIG